MTALALVPAPTADDRRLVLLGLLLLALAENTRTLAATT